MEKPFLSPIQQPNSMTSTDNIKTNLSPWINKIIVN